MAKTVLVAVGGLVLGLVVGLALGMAFSDSGAGGAPAVSVDGPSTSGASAAVQSRPDEGAAEDTQHHVQREPSRRHVGDGVAAAAEVLAAADIGVVPTGDGVIRGHVRTEDGAPVSGVEMVVRPHPLEDWDASSEDLSPAERLATFARKLRWDEVTRVAALTEADGSYELSGLADRGHGISARHAAFLVRRSDGDGGSVKPNAVVDWVATPLTRASFVVLAPDGVDLDRAQIKLTSGRRNVSMLWHPDMGPTDVPPGTYAARAVAGEHSELSSKARDVTFERGRVDHIVTFELRSASGVGGSVRREGPESHESVQVWLLRVVDGAPPSPSRLIQAGTSARVSVSRRSGTYSFPDLAPGTYAIGVARSNDLPRDVQLVEVPEHFVRHDLVLPDHDRAECIEIRAYAPDGSPVTEISGTLHWESRRRHSSRGFRAVERPDGALWVPIPREFDRTSGTHRIQVQSKIYGVVTRDFDAGPNARIEVRFADPARLLVEVAGYLGSGAEGRLSVFVMGASGGWGGRDVELDAEGRAELAPLTPGTHWVGVRPKHRSGRNVTLAARELSLVSGENTATLSLPALHSLTVQLSGTAAGRRVSLSRGEENHGSAPPDANGQVVFDLLPPGEYTVRVYNGEGGTKTVHVPGTTLVRF